MPSLDLGPVVGPQGEQGTTGAQGIRGEQGLPGPNQVTNSTATPLTGVLTGNGSAVGVANIDPAPTPDSTGFAQSGGTDKAIKGRVSVYGLGKNLLDNAYFLNPVNQRGQTVYPATASGLYCIDRWGYQCRYGTVTLNSNGLNMAVTTASGANFFNQAIPGDNLLNKQLTVSILDSQGNLRTFPVKVTAKNVNVDNTVTLDGVGMIIRINIGTNFVFTIRKDSAVFDITIQAVKLELGTEQTLCHNEGTAEAPVWVLNEIPDYGEELRKCLQYYVRLEKLYSIAGGNYVRFGVVNAYSATIGMCFIPLPVPLKARSTAPTIAFSNIQLQNGQASFAVTDIAFRGLTHNGIYLDLTSSGLTTGAMYLVKGDYPSGGSLYTDGRLEISVEP